MRRRPSASRTVKGRADDQTAGRPQNATSQHEQIYGVVRAIPRGKVATYGQLALLAGIHAGHRIAARAMQICPAGLPWHRVLAKKDARRAKIALLDPDHAALQQKRLAAEGVRFDTSGYVSLALFGWLPSELATQKRSGHDATTPRRPKNR